MAVLDSGLEARYADHYRRRSAAKVYPVEFVVRALLGSYPRLQLDRTDYPGKRVLDLGCGDGRNMPLLHDLGFEVHGVEISAEICAQTQARMQQLGVPVHIEQGHNSGIPFDDGAFDYLLACHSCYYVAAGARFGDNLGEIHRVLGPSGTFVFSAPMPDTYILKGAEALGDGHYRIVEDPYGVRNGVVFRAFDDEEELAAALAGRFGDLRIGSWRNDFWGIEEKLWIVVCNRTP